MAAKGKELAGPIIGIIGTTMILVAGFFYIIFGDLISIIATLSFGILGLVGAILGFTGVRVAGGILMLIAGIAPYIAFYITTGEFFFLGFYIRFLLIAIDPILLILGGILGLALKR